MYKPISQLNPEQKEKVRESNRMKSQKYGQKYRDFKSMWQLKRNMEVRKELDRQDSLAIKKLADNILRRNKGGIKKGRIIK